MPWLPILLVVLLACGAGPAPAAEAEDATPAATARLSETSHRLALAGQKPLDYAASAGWLTLAKDDTPVAEIFHVAYTVKPEPGASRPVTFVVNGGPGAASAYLHVGMMGPRIVAFAPDCTALPPPAQLIDNPETWLAFTDLVFVDPVGTGYSRMVPAKPGEGKDEEKPEPPFDVDADLRTLADFIRLWLTEAERWSSPVFIAGESYGGFRVGGLARLLPGEYGVPLNGAILVSPALDFRFVDSDRADVLSWAVLMPSLAATAELHGRATTVEPPEAQWRWAAEVLTPALMRGNDLPADQRSALYADLAARIGLPPALVARQGGRIDMRLFARELLRDQGRVLGLYDATVTAADPDPAALRFSGVDPTLEGVLAVFGGGVMRQLTSALKVDSDRRYELLSSDVNRAWDWSKRLGNWQGYVETSTALAAALAGQPGLRVWISHGLHDLVTPPFASAYLVAQMALDDDRRGRLIETRYPGGHMYYTRAASRTASFADASAFYAAALARSATE